MDVLRLPTLLRELPTERTRLLDNLGRLRREVGPITPELSDALADHMGIRRGEVHEVVSFYSFLQVPSSALRVCTGPVCDCLGARELLARARDGRRGAPALEVPCLGHCDLAPVPMRGDQLEPAGRIPNEPRRVTRPRALGRDARRVRGRGGLAALRALPAPERIVEELKASGLAGYGGAGFPTGRKWEAVLREPGPTRTSS